MNRTARFYVALGAGCALLILAALGLASTATADVVATSHLQVIATNTPAYRIYLPVSARVYSAAERPELGDAPDSSNSYGVGMTAYPSGGPPGILARFPTVFTAGAPPYGPLHFNKKLIYFLGPAITAEKEADIGFDADGVNNLKPPSDVPDLDRADDGVVLAPLPHCAPTKLAYTVTVLPGAPPSKAYVNLWFDWDRSGDWGAIPPCQGAAAPEWAVQNQVLSLLTPGTYTFTTPAFLPYNPNPNRCLWWRITLSSHPAAAADGSGTANGYEFGETEDYYQCGEIIPTPSPTPTATRSPTLTPTATPTRQVSPTATPTPTPTKKPPYSIIVIKLHADGMTPLPGWQMALFVGPTCAGQPLAVQTTDERGLTDFVDLEPGTYSVLEEVRAEYEPQMAPCQTIAVGDPPSLIAAALDYPPGGLDEFPSGALLTLDVPGAGVTHVTFNGPTTVRRSDPHDTDGDGRFEIETELLSLSLTGMGPGGPLLLRESPSRASLGRIVQQASGVDFPADSFFDVFTELSMDGGQNWLPLEQPVRMQAVINTIPPVLAYYRPPQPTAVPVIGPGGQVIATIRHALHVPLPPYEKIIIFVNHKLKAPTPTPTPTRTRTPTPTATPTQTPTATPTQKPVLTGIASTFYVTADGYVVITVHVQDPALSLLLYDMEVFFNEQRPPWAGGQPVHGPQGWEPFPVPGGIGWVTTSTPLVACQPVQFVVQLPPTFQVGDAIWLHMTDKDHKNLGYVISQRVSPPGIDAALSRQTFGWLSGLDPDCTTGQPARTDER